MADTFFDLPNSPEDFGVSLPLPNLRRIDFSALEFDTLRRVVIEYIRTYYPDNFNDFVANNGVIMFIEALAYIGAVNAQHSDVLVGESFLPTAQSRDAVINHLQLINKTIVRQTPAVVDVAVSLASPAPTVLSIPAGTRFTINGPDGNPVVYEVFRAPGDFENSIEIPPNKRGIIAYGIEGRFLDPLTSISSGGADQEVVIENPDVLDEPIFVDLVTGTTVTRWTRINSLANADSNDEVYEVSFGEDTLTILFGDDINGKSPLAGQEIRVTYRVGGGVRGRIAAGVINETRFISPNSPSSAPLEVTFRNLLPSSGGLDEQSLESAKKLAPKSAAVLGSVTSGEDYAIVSSDFNHPIYGSVLKSVATVRTEINANIVELYVLASGENDFPVTPSDGLKIGLSTYLDEINTLTDEVRVLDGKLKTVDLKAQIIVSKNADANIVRDMVESVIDDFFDITDRNMGDGVYISELYESIQKVDGVRFLSILNPNDNILPSGKISSETTGDNLVGLDELIVIGNREVEYFYERRGI